MVSRSPGQVAPASRFSALTLLISDVDDTLAPPFRPIQRPLARAMARMIMDGTLLFLVSGQSIANIERRVVHAFPPALRRQILVGHCHGAEVFGYGPEGRRITSPLFSVRESAAVAGLFRDVPSVVAGVLRDHGIRVCAVMPGEVPHLAARNGHGAIFDNRGVQVAVDFPWLGCPRAQAADPRPALVACLNDRLAEAGMPAQARLAGPLGIDVVADGVDKSLALSRLLSTGDSYHLATPYGDAVGDCGGIEVWGDQFSPPAFAADLRMLSALPPGVRAVNFGTTASPGQVAVHAARTAGPAGVRDYLAGNDSG